MKNLKPRRPLTLRFSKKKTSAEPAVSLTIEMLIIMQYVSPTMGFLFGTFVYHEPMNVWRLAAFALIWCAVALYTADAVVRARREKRG